MIKPVISVFIKTEEDVGFVKECIEGYDFYVQVAFHKREDTVYAESLMGEYEDNITSIHLPGDLGALDYRKGGVVEYLRGLFNVDLLVTHPFSAELDEIVGQVVEQKKYTLCLENFPTKKRKLTDMGNPVNLVAKYGIYLVGEFLGLCLDFSHLDDALANYVYVRSFLPYTKMIHASNRVGEAEHVPIFKKSTEMNPLRLLSKIFVFPDLSVREVVLEYMPMYRKDLIKHNFWLIQYMKQKRKKFGDVI